MQAVLIEVIEPKAIHLLHECEALGLIHIIKYLKETQPHMSVSKPEMDEADVINMLDKTG